MQFVDESEMSKAEPQVREQLNNQKLFLGELEKSIASLVDSLEGVIRDEQSPECKADKVLPKLVPLAEEIRTNNFRIEDAIDAILGIIRRCEL
jgi:hypothetical protein